MKRLARVLGDAAFGGTMVIVVLMGVTLMFVLGLIVFFLLGGVEIEMPIPGS